MHGAKAPEIKLISRAIPTKYITKYGNDIYAHSQERSIVTLHANAALMRYKNVRTLFGHELDSGCGQQLRSPPSL